MKTKIIQEENFFNGRQSIEANAVYLICDAKVEIQIDRDAYDSQSSAIAKVYSMTDKKWNRLASIHYTQMECVKQDLFYQRKPHELTLKERGYLLTDITTLVKKSELILS